MLLMVHGFLGEDYWSNFWCWWEKYFPFFSFNVCFYEKKNPQIFFINCICLIIITTRKLQVKFTYALYYELIAQLIKNPLAMKETLVQFLGWEDPLEKGKATHSSILAWRISWTVHGVAKSQIWLTDFHFHFYYELEFLF